MRRTETESLKATAMLNHIAQMCKEWRIIHEYPQKQICVDTGYSPSVVSRFENGEVNNAIIFAWYVEHGFDYLERKYRKNGR